MMVRGFGNVLYVWKLGGSEFIKSARFQFSILLVFHEGQKTEVI